MIRRNLEPVLRQRAESMPVVTVTGPRQSGKTTLCRAVFASKPYVSLEPLDIREAARVDPRGFLREYREGAILDEIQNTPELLSYIQQEVDEDPAPGRFILTGSQHLQVLEGVTQSLAGRTAVLTLLPLSLDEVERFGPLPDDPWPVVYAGGYPRIHDQKLPPEQWLADYVTTYVQRDVRSILNIGDLQAFASFVRLVAGRTATEINLSALGSDAGVSHNTSRSWLSVLEAGFLTFRAGAWRPSVRKQEIKAAKIHFYDSGLVCSLLGITNPDQLRHHPLRGQIFESWVASEIAKAQVNAGTPVKLHHYRDAQGQEVDIVCETPSGLVAVEVKSGATVATDMFNPLRRFGDETVRKLIVLGGDAAPGRHGIGVRSWKSIQEVDWV